MHERSLDDWLQLLEARHPVEIDLGLERLSAVASRLNLPPLAKRVAVVAGTNGKGSCVRTLELLGIQSGLRVGAYTSPHILRYNERLRVQGNDVPDDEWCRAFQAIEGVRGDISLTYFEMGTLAAMIIMAAKCLDLAILEVGMGGRFDAVNIVDGDVAIITAIDIDHAAWLGDTREVIALEKAGIARAGQPVVCCDTNPPQSLVARLVEIGAVPFHIEQAFTGQLAEEGISASFADLQGTTYSFEALPQPRLPLPSVLAAVEAGFLLGLKPDQKCLHDLFVRAALDGRFQSLVFRNRRIILDVGHNPAAAVYLGRRLEMETGRVCCVAAIMADKDVTGFVQGLKRAVSEWFVGDLAAVPRGLPGEQLAAVIRHQGCQCQRRDSIEEAFDLALAISDDNGIIVVCGSFHTVGAIMKHIHQDEHRGAG